MKNLFTLCLFILVLISFNNSLSTNNTNQLKSTNKSNNTNKNTNTNKINTTLNSLFNKSYQDKKAKSPSKSKKETKTEFKTLENRHNNPNMLVNKEEKLQVQMSDWLKVQSQTFSNIQKYPNILTIKNKKKAILFNDDNFRINESFIEDKKSKSNPPSELFFWFRYSDKNLYYTNTPNDLNVLGSLPIRSIIDVQNQKEDSIDSNCFDIKDTEELNWSICTQDEKTKLKWMCRIKADLGTEEDICKDLNLQQSKPLVINQQISQPIIMIPLPSKNCNEKWNYENLGKDWECDCSEGKEQSPIDLPDYQSAKSSPVKPLFNYITINAKQTENSFDNFLVKDQYFKIYYESNLIRIKHPNMGKVITLDGAVYIAQDIVFHTPAEHILNGKKYDMEIQIIHYGQTKGDIAKQLVVSFMIQKAPGFYNRFVDKLDFTSLPNPLNKIKDITNDLFIPDIFYNSDEDDFSTMKNFSFYTYQGSITSPPCTERTIHIVASEPIKLSSTAIQLFREAIRIPDTVDKNGNMILNNTVNESSRKTQPLNGRKVYYYNSKKFDDPEPVQPVRRKEKNGHYERMNKKITSYFHVPSEKPSGLPNAFLVSEEEAKGKI